MPAKARPRSTVNAVTPDASTADDPTADATAVPNAVHAATAHATSAPSPNAMGTTSQAAGSTDTRTIESLGPLWADARLGVDVRARSLNGALRWCVHNSSPLVGVTGAQ